MARLLRSDVFEIAEQHGYVKGQSLSEAERNNIREDLKTALRLKDFPPTKVFKDDGTFRLMTIDEAIENLMEELV